MVLPGSADHMSAAFGATLANYKHAQGVYRGCAGPVTVPEELADIITGVLGLDNRPAANPHFRRPKTPAAHTTTFTPAQLARLYDFPVVQGVRSQAIAIVELGGGYLPCDSTAAFSAWGLPLPQISAVNVDGAGNAPGSQADVEVALDGQVGAAIFSACTSVPAGIIYVFSPNTEQGFVDGVHAAVHSDAKVVSISWGGPENGYSAAGRQEFDAACQAAAALGLTIFAASGDGGSSDGLSGLNVDYPAASPYVVACGGTTLTASGTSIPSEVVWNDGQGDASGGGFSTVAALPSWQVGVSGPGRMVPDVAGDADPATGYQVWVDGQPGVVGGTSCVAPLWSALLAVINTVLAAQGKGSLGFVNPTLYQNPQAFHGITQGNNETGDNTQYTAGRAPNPCCGLGSPIGKAVQTALSGVAPPPPPPSPPPPPPPPSPPPPHRHRKHHRCDSIYLAEAGVLVETDTTIEVS